MSQTTPRIAPLQPPYAPEIQQQFDRIMRGAPPLVLFRVMAGNIRSLLFKTGFSSSTVFHANRYPLRSKTL